MRTRAGMGFPILRRELLRYNNVKRLMSQDTQPGNASAPQNHLQRCSWGIQTGVRNGKLYGAAVARVKRRRRPAEGAHPSRRKTCLLIATSGRD